MGSVCSDTLETSRPGSAASSGRCQPRDSFSAHGNLGSSQECGPDSGKERGHSGGSAGDLPGSPGHKMESELCLPSPVPVVVGQGPMQTVVLTTEGRKRELREAWRQ